MPDWPIWEWLAIASAAVAVLAAAWSRIRYVFDWIFGLLIISNGVDGSLLKIIVGYLNQYSKSFQVSGYYVSEHLFIRSLQKIQRTAIRVITAKSTLMWYKRRPLWFFAAHDNESCKLNYIRWTVNWKQLLWDALQWEEDKKQRDLDQQNERNRFSVIKRFGSHADSNAPSKAHAIEDAVGSGLDEIAFGHWQLVHWNREDIGIHRETSSLDLLSLSPELVDLVEEIRFWRHSEDWYKERGIPWRRSYGFFGVPGGGKTSLARAMAEDLDLPINSFDLASMDNYDFNAAWESALENAPCMVLLEDVDAVFQDRVNVAKSIDGLTFDCLLNCLDGAQRPDGVLLIITTNYIDKLDPAMCREGRMDRQVEFKPIDLEGKIKLGERILQDLELAKKIAMESHGESAAAFQERCFRIALAQKFAERKLSA